ncbi:hypothetical protein PRZ48_003938 [Zasmidium cellare]|uniref:Cystinosin n=1 Tax=Zasmidium cellare TaxID=395010 RepID=A0ABR0EYP1_ZASCE|nr:hypothetical protein PRZ48_003938 [Zasmidium cellare]
MCWERLAFCALLLFSSTIRSEYAARYPASPEPTVRFNDFCNLHKVYALVYVKLWTAVFKYTPQAVSNFRRKSTLGWSIYYVHLDISGGTFSLVQLLIDASLQPDWSGLTGNPLKLWLAGISLTADVIFLIQHYVLYGAVEAKNSHTERDARHGEVAPEEGIMLASFDVDADGEEEGSAMATPDSYELEENKVS